MSRGSFGHRRCIHLVSPNPVPGMDQRTAVRPGASQGCFSRRSLWTPATNKRPGTEAWLSLTFTHPELSWGRRGIATQKGLRNDPACLSYLLFHTKGPEAPAASGGPRKGRNNGRLGYRCSLQRNQRRKAAKPP